MNRDFSIVALVLAFALASGTMTQAQDKPGSQPAPAAREAAAPVPLKIQVVISRYQGEKKISSLPYTLSVNSDARTGRANLRMGSKIPVTMMAPPTAGGKPIPDAPTTGPIQYQDVGTNIDCLVVTLADGRFRLEITVDDSSVYSDEKDIPGGVKGSPSFRSFRANDSLILKDGGTAQFTAATDKVTGEIVRVDVTLTVVK